MFYEKRRLKKGLGLQLCLKETPAQVFRVNFVKFLRTPFLHNNSGRLLLHSVSTFDHDIYLWSLKYHSFNDSL